MIVLVDQTSVNGVEVVSAAIPFQGRAVAVAWVDFEYPWKKVHPPSQNTIERYLLTWLRLAARFGPLAKSDDWVFANPETEKPYWPGQIQENGLIPAAQRAGLGRIGWHTFRHSHSTLLHALGVDLKVQQELLRHADIRTTMNIYIQAVPTALREANSKVVRLVLPTQVA